MRRVFLGLLLFLPAAAHADEIYTRSGGHLTGEIVERGPQSLVVDIGIGRVELPLSYIERIVPGAAPVTVYRERARALDPGDLDGWMALGRWARENDLTVQATDAFEHVVARDPAHAAAQRALGRVSVNGEWMTREESYAARGLVRFEGAWVSPEEREDRLAERADADRRARAEADEHARLRAIEAKLRAAEAEARIAEAQAKAQEAEARAAEVRAEAFPVPLPFVSGFFPSYAPAFAPALAPSFVPSYGFGPSFSGHLAPRGHRPTRVSAARRLTPSSRPARRVLRTPGCSR
jgi:hypothetical protein